jgi:hypothetical protein
MMSGLAAITAAAELLPEEDECEEESEGGGGGAGSRRGKSGSKNSGGSYKPKGAGAAPGSRKGSGGSSSNTSAAGSKGPGKSSVKGKAGIKIGGVIGATDEDTEGGNLTSALNNSSGNNSMDSNEDSPPLAGATLNAAAMMGMNGAGLNMANPYLMYGTPAMVRCLFCYLCLYRLCICF